MFCQRLTLSEDARLALINAHRGVKYIVEQVPDRVFALKQVVLPYRLVKTACLEHLSHIRVHANQIYIPAPLAVLAHHRFQHVNTAHVAVVHKVQAQQK